MSVSTYISPDDIVRDNNKKTNIMPFTTVFRSELAHFSLKYYTYTYKYVLQKYTSPPVTFIIIINILTEYFRIVL